MIPFIIRSTVATDGGTGRTDTRIALLKTKIDDSTRLVTSRNLTRFGTSIGTGNTTIVGREFGITRTDIYRVEFVVGRTVGSARRAAITDRTCLFGLLSCRAGIAIGVGKAARFATAVDVKLSVDIASNGLTPSVKSLVAKTASVIDFLITTTTNNGRASVARTTKIVGIWL